MLISIDLPSSFIEKNFTQQTQQQKPPPPPPPPSHQHQNVFVVTTLPQPCEKSKEANKASKKDQFQRTLSKSSIDNNPIFMIYTKYESTEDVNKERKSLWRLPIANRLKTIWWIYTWPIKFILTITIPNPKTFRKLYPLSFIMCILWIGLNAYMIVWMVTVVGEYRRVLRWHNEDKHCVVSYTYELYFPICNLENWV